MPPPIYSDPPFFTAYALLPRSLHGLTSAPEWPSLLAMIGSITNARVLDLGCGYGWFCRWAAANHAREVLGIDISSMMLAKAQGAWEANERVSYRVGDLEDWEGEGTGWDVVYSSLTFHYVQSIKPLFRKIHSTLLPGGRLIFSIEHPIFTAPLTPQPDDITDQWILSSYQHEGPRIRHWLGSDVTKYHRTLTTYMEALLEPGFKLEGFQEWKPNEGELREHPEWEVEMHRPMFLLVAARKG